MKSLSYYSIISVMLMSVSLKAQNKNEIAVDDKSGLEGIIVEKYYEYNPAEAMDTTGGALPKGSVCYRIYADLKTGYSLQAVYGVPNHALTIGTTTKFYNNVKWGNVTGDKIDDLKIIYNTGAFDSYLTMGAATDEHNGILKSEDTDGSVLKINSFKKADGLAAGKIKPIAFFGFDLLFFNNPVSASVFSGNNGSWAVFGGVKGPTPENKVLIAQLTTDGKLSFELNLQIGTPNGKTVNYVAKNPENSEIKLSFLTYSLK